MDSAKYNAEVLPLLKRLHEIFCEEGLVNPRFMGGDFNGWLPDGRAVRHKFQITGYERTGPTVAKERAKRPELLAAYLAREAEIKEAVAALEAHED